MPHRLERAGPHRGGDTGTRSRHDQSGAASGCGSTLSSRVSSASARSADQGLSSGSDRTSCPRGQCVAKGRQFTRWPQAPSTWSARLFDDASPVTREHALARRGLDRVHAGETAERRQHADPRAEPEARQAQPVVRTPAHTARRDAGGRPARRPSDRLRVMAQRPGRESRSGSSTTSMSSAAGGSPCAVVVVAAHHGPGRVVACARSRQRATAAERHRGLQSA